MKFSRFYVTLCGFVAVFLFWHLVVPMTPPLSRSLNLNLKFVSMMLRKLTYIGFDMILAPRYALLKHLVNLLLCLMFRDLRLEDLGPAGDINRAASTSLPRFHYVSPRPTVVASPIMAAVLFGDFQKSVALYEQTLSPQSKP